VTTVNAKTAITLTATVMTANGAAVSPGQVQFCDASATYCTDIHLLGLAQLNASGVATLTFVPGVGTHHYYAQFVGITAGATKVLASSSTTLALTVSGTYATTNSLMIAVPAQPGNYTLTATVSGPESTGPTGNVSFVDMTNFSYVLATAPLVSSTAGVNFTQTLNTATGIDPVGVATADFNGDGIPDIVTANEVSNTVSVLQGKGDGTFSVVSSPVVGNLPGAVVVGDFNGDGKADLAVTNAGAQLTNSSWVVTILLGNGDGMFTAAGNESVMGVGSLALCVGDFNGDGIADLAVANYDSSTISIMLGNGDGTFQAPTLINVGRGPSSIVTADFNNDGYADLAVTNHIDNSISILLGKGDGTFSAGASLTAGSAPSGLVVADFNGDGKPDLGVVSGNSTVSIFLGNGDVNGTFGAAIIHPTPSVPTDLAVGDFNGDGIADLAVTAGPIDIFLGKGDGTLTLVDNNLGASTVNVVTADWNGDGITDVAATDITNNRVVVFLDGGASSTATVTGISPVGSITTHLVDAVYAGAGLYSASTSNTVSLTPERVVTANTLTANPTSSGYGQQVALTGTLSPTALNITQNHTATGMMAFSSNGASLGAAQTVTSSAATLNTTTLPAGNDNLSAVYSGDTNFAPSTGLLAYTVSGNAIQTITFPTPAPAYVGTSVALSATSTAGTAITFKVVSGPATLNGTTLTYTGVGSVVVEADAPGNATYAPDSAQDTIAATLLTEPVGTSSGTISTVVTFSSAGTLGTLGVFTQGAIGLEDFAQVAGGSCAVGTAYAVGQSCTVDFSFTPTRPGQRLGGIVLSTSANAVLANSYIYGVGNGPQVGWLPGTQTLLGSGLIEPSGVAVDGSGDVYVSQYGASVAEIAVSGAQRTIGSLAVTADVAVDGSGNLFVIDQTSVYEVLAVGGVIPASPTIVTLATGFSELNGIAVSGTGNVYLANGTGSAADGAVYELVAVNGVIPASSAKITVGSGFGWVTGVAVDANGNVFASDSGNKAVYEIEAVNGRVGASSVVRALGGTFTNPSNVGLDAANDVYVTDLGTGVISEFMAVNEIVPANPIIRTVGTGIVSPQGMVVDSNGNIFIADHSLAQVVKLDYADPPSLTFAATAVGSVSSDSPQTVTMANDGNMPLMDAAAFTPPATGSNPSITAGFVINSSSSTCQQQNVVPVTPSPLAPGAECTDVVSFKPVAVGVDNGKLVTTDNALNVTDATQTVLLNGTGLGEPTTATLAATPANPTNGVPITLTVTVAAVPPGTGTPTGTVTFFVDGAAAGTPVALTAGVSSYVVTGLSGGAHTFGCSYSGDTVFSGSTCNTVSITEVETTALKISSGTNPVAALAPVTFMAHLSIGGQPAGAGYSVGFGFSGSLPANQPPSATATTDATGTATYTAVGFHVGATAVTAVFAATPAMTGSTASISETAYADSTSMTLIASPNPAYQYNPVSVLATVADTTVTAEPVGSVTFVDLSTNPVTPLGTLTLAGVSGALSSATLTTSTLAPGVHTIQATYGPSSDFIAPAPVTTMVTILPQDYTLTANPPSITIETEHHGSMTLGLTSIGGFAAPITLSCAGTIPEWVTCEFSPQQVMLPAGGTNVPATLTIDTDALLDYKSDAGLGGRVILAGLLPVMLIGFRRRRGLRGLVVMAIASVIVMAMTACSGQYPPHTTPGTYTVTVQASGQTAGASAPTVHTLDVTLVVTP